MPKVWRWWLATFSCLRLTPWRDWRPATAQRGSSSLRANKSGTGGKPSDYTPAISGQTFEPVPEFVNSDSKPTMKPKHKDIAAITRMAIDCGPDEPI
jgi:hypothetical protein